MMMTSDEKQKHAEQILTARDQYYANMERLAALDRLLAALRTHQACPCNIHWREVLTALAEIPNPPLELANAERDREFNRKEV